MLEERVHRWAKRDKRIMVYTGPIMGKKPKMIGKDKQNIAVPEAFFKVLYAPEQNRSIAFIYPNSPSPGSISKYAVTVAEVERRTGIKFRLRLFRRFGGFQLLIPHSLEDGYCLHCAFLLVKECVVPYHFPPFGSEFVHSVHRDG